MQYIVIHAQLCEMVCTRNYQTQTATQCGSKSNTIDTIAKWQTCTHAVAVLTTTPLAQVAIALMLPRLHTPFIAWTIENAY